MDGEGQNESTLFFKYENMELFCYGYGVIGHDMRGYEEGLHNETNLPFGKWLRAMHDKNTHFVSPVIL